MHSATMGSELKMHNPAGGVVVLRGQSREGQTACATEGSEIKWGLY